MRKPDPEIPKPEPAPKPVAPPIPRSHVSVPEPAAKKRKTPRIKIRQDRPPLDRIKTWARRYEAELARMRDGSYEALVEVEGASNAWEYVEEAGNGLGPEGAVPCIGRFCGRYRFPYSSEQGFKHGRTGTDPIIDENGAWYSVRVCGPWRQHYNLWESMLSVRTRFTGKDAETDYARLEVIWGAPKKEGEE